METVSNVQSVPASFEIDEAALSQFLKQQLPWFHLDAGLSVRYFSHGQSNPTYLVSSTSHPKQRIVLRKQPPGHILPSAHRVLREATIMRALQGYLSPIPRIFASCSSPSIIGTPFFLMQFVEGIVFPDYTFSDLSPKQRLQVFRGMSSTLAAIHSVPHVQAGLADFGSPKAFLSRQISRWSQQFVATVLCASATSVAQMHQLRDILVPWGEAASALTTAPPVCIVHGDFGIHNIVWGRSGAGASATYSPLAVLDWELSTIGDPWADVAYMCMCFQHFGDKSISILPQAFPDADKGIPSQSEVLRCYCSARGVSVPQDFHIKSERFFLKIGPSSQFLDFHILFMYLALSFFRLASIVQGVVARFHQGNSARITDPQVAEAMSQAVEILSSKGLQLALQQQQPSPAASELPDFVTSSCFGDVSVPAAACLHKLHSFIENHALAGEREWLSHVAPSGPSRWQPVPVIEHLKMKAKELGLWNLWLPPDLQQKVKEMGELGTGLSNREYCLAARMMGAFPWLSEVFNCSAPDTGNMELLLRFGNAQQQQKYLLPLLKGETRSCFAMTEPNTASSNPTQIQTTITDVDNGIVVHGRKWWISGACDPRCSFALVFGLHREEAAAHKRHSIVIVPMDSAGVCVVRPLSVFGYDDAPHGHAEVTFSNVLVPSSNLVFQAGAGFFMGQARLGPGRLHHCIRAIGCADRAIDLYVSRSLNRRISHDVTLSSKQTVQHTLAECIMSRDTSFASCMMAAYALDVYGNASAQARHAVAVAKVVSPRAALAALDAAIQIHGAEGVCSDQVLAALVRYAGMRCLRLADGPDEVHLDTIAKLHLSQRMSKL